MNKVIHIIDDDMDILTILHIFFEKKGFDVIADYNGDDLDVTHKPCPELYLIDINLAGKNGVDLCKLIKRECSHIPVVLMSANADLEILAKGCDADAFVSKPFDMYTILSTVNKLVA
jgi:two-component system, OmpR family, response regulator VicR